MSDPKPVVTPAGYHLTPIPKGVYGEISKIVEELEELRDADGQGIRIMVLTELADLIGAIEAVAVKRGASLEDLVQMSRVTSRAFQSGARK